MQAKRPTDSRVTLTYLMGTLESNTLGNVHGGVLMKLCDEAGAMAAMKHAGNIVVTVAVDRMTFNAPVNLGDLVTFDAQVTWVGRTSIESRVLVTAENVLSGKRVETNTAHIVYVALSREERKPCPVPPLDIISEEEKAMYAAATERQEMRLQLRENEQRRARASRG